MEKRNVWLSPAHKDERGIILDVLTGREINHVALLTRRPYSVGGNHYHPRSTQHVLVLQGWMEYWWRPAGEDGEGRREVISAGDMVTSPPGEAHAMRFEDDCQFIVFVEGPRGGDNYEADTVRVPSIIPAGVYFK